MSIGQISFSDGLVLWKTHNFFGEDTLEISPKFSCNDGNFQCYVKVDQLVPRGTVVEMDFCTLHKNRRTFYVQLGVKVENGHEVKSEWFNTKQLNPEFEFAGDGFSGNQLIFSFEIRKQAVPVRALSGLRNALSRTDDSTCSEDQKQRSSFSRGQAKALASLKELLDSGIASDVILQLGRKEFKAHRCVLSMRSPVFAAMLSQDWVEKHTGVVQVKDCDCGTFSDFLRYVYSGELSDVTLEKAMHLYKTAHKYQLEELKEECLEYIGSNLTVEQFCDAFALSLRYEEVQLTESATEFFLDNAASIVVTEDWENLQAANAKAANSLVVQLARKK